MDKSCEIIDLCVKSEKSDDTSTTIPFETNSDVDAQPEVPEIAENEICNINGPSNRERTEQWIHEQTTIIPPPPIKLPPIGSYPLENPICSINNPIKRDYTEQWVTEQRTIVTPSPKPPLTEGSLEQTTALENRAQDVVGAIPIEITELVNKECAIKLINHLVIYAFTKVTEADLHRKLISVTPDIDPQINYRTNIGFRCVYERCVVLFYEALLDLTEILHNFTPPHQEIVILWMYNTVENITKAHGVDSSFMRRERYLEVLLRDFSNSQSEIPDPRNIFFNICRKMQPTTMVPVGNQGPTMTSEGPPKPKKTRRPRTRKPKQTV